MTLAGPELDRFAGLIRARPLVLSAWTVGVGRTPPAQAMTAAAETKTLADTLAARARKALAG